MLIDDAAAVRRLSEELLPLRGLWPGAAQELVDLGFAKLADLAGQNAHALAGAYRRLTKRPDDPLFPVFFAALISFAESGVASPWWRILRAEPSLARQPSPSSQSLARETRFPAVGAGAAQEG